MEAFSMRTVMLDEMTWYEVKKYLERNNIAIIPIGVVELHGEWPLGMEYFTPLAIAKLVAEEVDGVVVPHIAYTFAGATRAGVGTVNIQITESVRYIKQVCLSLLENGFKRFLLLSWHGPASITVSTVVRELFDETGVPFAYIDLERKDLLGGRLVWENDEIWLGVFKVLGRLDIVFSLMQSMDTLSEEQLDMRTIKDMPKPMSDVLSRAVVGYLYTHESQHYPIMKKRSAEEIERLADEGIKKLKEVVRAMEPRKLMESLKEYIEVLEKCEMTERGERIRKLWRQRGS
jgi:creatinine amidohydrolase